MEDNRYSNKIQETPNRILTNSYSPNSDSQAYNLDYDKLPSIATSGSLSKKEKSVKKEVREYQI